MTKTVEVSSVPTRQRVPECHSGTRQPVPIGRAASLASLLQAGNRAMTTVIQRKCACGGDAPCQCDEEGQRKFTVNEPGDKYEREADRVAEQVMRMPAPGFRDLATMGLHSANSQGAPLPRAVRASLEPHLGVDLAAVRIHTGDGAAELSDGLNASAFTHGSDVYFARGMFNPETPRGKRLLVHELTHVIQQSGAGPGPRVIQRQKSGQPSGAAPAASKKRDPIAIEIKFPGWIWFTYMNGRYLVRIQADWLARQIYGASQEESLRLYKENRRPNIANPSLPVDRFIGELESRTGMQLLPAARAELTARSRIPLEEYGDFHYAAFIDDADLVRWFGADQWGQYVRRESGTGSPTREEGLVAHPVRADRSVLKGNSELSTVYLLLMEHFTALSQTPEVKAMLVGGLTTSELDRITAGNVERVVLTDLFCQAWTEYRSAGGTDLLAFEALAERILEQYQRGNLTAQANLLRIGTGGWPEHDELGIIHRNNGMLLYDRLGMPMRGITGVALRDVGFIGFSAPASVQRAAEALREKGLAPEVGVGDALTMNMIGQALGVHDTAMVAEAADATVHHLEDVGRRIKNGLAAEVVRVLGETVVFVSVFALGHALARLLMRAANAVAFAVGVALEVALRAAGYIMGLSFLGQTWEVLLRAAFHMSRVRDDSSGRPTKLSELHMNEAARPIQQLIANVAGIMGAMAFGGLMRRVRAGNSRAVWEDPNKAPQELQGGSQTAPPSTESGAPTEAGKQPTESGAPTEAGKQPTGTKTGAPGSESTAAAPVPAPRVWVNTRTGRYHLPNTRYYGATAEGRHMTLAEAQAEGYVEAGSGAGARPPSGVYSVVRPTEGDPRVVIRSWIGKGQRRAGLESEMMSAAEYAAAELQGWQRSHSQAPGLGAESGEAIRLAPELVNQVMQNRGIEGFLRGLRDLAEGERIHLTTETQTHPRTLRLSSIHYLVERPEGGRMITLFEAAIEVRPDGSARAGIRMAGSDAYQFGPWFQP